MAQELKDKPVIQVTCHAFNKAGDMIALSPNSNEVYIYRTGGSEENEKWELKWILTEHVGLVSGIDWNPETNLIATCGHDRNAYVWKLDEKSNTWKPTLVILRITRAATAVKWSPLGNKFAVTSGMKCVPICHYEKSSDWWVSKAIKGHKSTVLSVAWCPNNKFVLTGSSDLKARVFSAYLKKLDSAEDDGFGSLWKDQHEFGTCLAEFDQARSWVHSVSWSPNGFRLAFAGHGSTVSFVQLVVGAPPIVQTVPCPDLPMLDVQFLSDNALIAAGFSCNPTLFTASGSEAEPVWAVGTLLDKAEKPDLKKGGAANSAFADAKKLWSDSTAKGIAVGASTSAVETVLPTKHQNTIVCVWRNKAGLVTTSALDGRVLFWDLAKCGVDVKGLHIA